MPNGWYAGQQNALSQAFVKAYNAKYGGSAADINADSAEAYSVGETIAEAVAATHSLDNAKVIAWLHSAPDEHRAGPGEATTASARTPWPPSSSSSGRRVPSSCRCCRPVLPARCRSSTPGRSGARADRVWCAERADALRAPRAPRPSWRRRR